MRVRTVRIFSVLMLAVLVGGPACFGGGSSQRKDEPLYQATYSYATTAPGGKCEVTVGIIAPQFEGEGETYWRENKDDETVSGMVRALRAGLEQLLIDKGFSTAGPYDNLENMSFPEKKGCDLVLYPSIDITVGHELTNVRTEVETSMFGATSVLRCDMVINPSGVIRLLAREPLSGEKMWVKTIEVTGKRQVFAMQGEPHCTGKAVTPEVHNAWAQTHEAMYRDVMASLDRYVSAEEFQALKRQAIELREKKAY